MKSQQSLNMFFLRMFQFPGEFIIIYPGTVYMSFDFGFNIIEYTSYKADVMKQDPETLQADANKGIQTNYKSHSLNCVYCSSRRYRSNNWSNFTKKRKYCDREGKCKLKDFNS